MIRSTFAFSKAVILAVTVIFSTASEAKAQVQTSLLWGMTWRGGQYDGGTIYTTDLSGNNQTIQQNFLFSNSGGNPAWSLLRASDGKLYGLTTYGGANGQGVLFQYDPNTATYTKKHDFDVATTGQFPFGASVQANNGKLYGMTAQGGTYSLGVLFQYDLVSSTVTKKMDFDSGPNGNTPRSPLLQASDGKLYGMLTGGGMNSTGVLFQYDPVSSTYTLKYDFVVGTEANGSAPMGSLIQASDGKLYGMTQEGGLNSRGVIFQYDPSSSAYTKKLDFAGLSNGAAPFGALLQANDGKFYGMTNQGGAYNLGVLFQYDPVTSICVKKLDFDGPTNGSTPYGSLIQASTGKLFGTTIGGGANNRGVLFQYDPLTSVYTKKIDFTGAIGEKPTDLIEINVDNVGIVSLEGITAMSLYPNPAHDLLTFEFLSADQNKTTMTIENLYGQIVYEAQISAATHKVHTENYAPGIYLVKVKTKTGTNTRKIILQ